MKQDNKKALDKNLLKELSKKAKGPWLLDASIDWAIIIATFCLIYAFPNPITIVCGLLMIGNRQHALVILGHDGTHFTLSKNKKMNDFLTNFFCFWPIGLTVSGYRTLHYKHHKNAGTEDDPELAHKRSRSPQWNLPANPIKILKYAALDMVGLSIPDYQIVITYSKPNKKSEYLPLLLWHLVFSSIFVISSLWWIPALWYTSLVTAFMMFFRLRLWLEHQGTSDTHRLHLNPIQGAILAPHNSWMHWEHHNWPSVPYHRLSKIRKHVTHVPVMHLHELLSFFQTAQPMSSGEILNKH